MGLIFDCSYDSTDLTNSFVVGRLANDNDFEKIVSTNNLNFESDIFFDVRADDMILYNMIINTEWTGILN